MLRVAASPLLPLVLAGAALLVAACTPPASNAKPCNDDGDCLASQVCLEGRCAEATAPPPLDAGGRGTDAGEEPPPDLDAGPVDASVLELDAGAGADAADGEDAASSTSDAGDDTDAGVDAGGLCSPYDEDGDGLGDECDNCPSVPNPLQEDVLETEAGQLADGVGDACDPRPLAPGDALLLFEGFHDPSAPPTWETLSCTWTVANGELTQSEGLGAKNCRLSFPAINAIDVAIETSVRVLTLEDESTANAGALVSIEGLDAWLCSVHTDDYLGVYRVDEGTAGTHSRHPLSVEPGDVRRLRAGGGERQMFCLGDSSFVYDHVHGGRDVGSVGLRTNDATAAFGYVAVYQLGGDVALPTPGAPQHRYSFGEPAGALEALDSEGDQHGRYLGDAVHTAGDLVIDGLGDGYVDLPNGLLSALDAVTLELWVTWNGTGTAGYWQHLFDFGNGTAGELSDVEVPDAGIAYTGEGHASLMLTPAMGNNQSWVRMQNPNGDVVFGLTAEALPTGRPVHVVVTYDPSAGEAAYYIDGGERRRASGTMPLALIEDVNNWIGRSAWRGDNRFDGSVDDVRIHDRALTPQEVLGSFQAGPDVDF